MAWLAPLTLEGKLVTLKPLSPDHHDELVEAARNGELWKVWYTQVPDPARMRAAIEKRLARQDAGRTLPFTVVSMHKGEIIGTTNYLNIDAENRRLEIGGTWYNKCAQQTGINTECKLLLLAHAFDTLNCIAVEFRTHFLNHPSRRAIERLGAKLDGVLRSHSVAVNGTLKDMCVYSIIAPEWPAVKAHLHWLQQS